MIAPTERAPEGGGETRTPDPREKRFLGQQFTLHLVAMLVLVAVAVWGGTAAAVTAATLFIAYASTMTGRAAKSERPEAAQHLRAFLGAMFVALLVGAVIWGIRSWALAGQPVDVTSGAKLTDATLDADGTARLTVKTDPGDSAELRVTFAARDGVAGGSPCLALSSLRFQGADIDAKGPVDLERTLTTTLGLVDDTGPEVTVDIQLADSADSSDSNDCRVSLTLEKAEYRR
ncbi:hypothetical protein ACFQ7F_16825 [Streptomyces sp. NPDC056486]|uniref:hypothetical protein n=1 Tax=Streptomyces sp. NPDC056486 TaxID=3345835 RepID=UPI00369DC758